VVVFWQVALEGLQNIVCRQNVGAALQPFRDTRPLPQGRRSLRSWW